MAEIFPMRSDPVSPQVSSVCSVPGAPKRYLRNRRNAIFVSREESDSVRSMVETISSQHLSKRSTAISRSRAVVGKERWYSCRSPSDVGGGQGSRARPKGYSNEINSILHEWLEVHRANPYPSPEDKQRLMGATGLSKMQLKNWFCNVRRRKLSGTIKRGHRTVRPNRK
ncbi:hypothetical protein GGI12_005427 [Dipsacomyces acuminosporus]|nr:hypothetical protein GGI12_005427 [Dipsacomyces acuminosporus]